VKIRMTTFSPKAVGIVDIRSSTSSPPGTSLWLASRGGLDPWLSGYTGAPTGSIPLQVIAAPGGRVRCIRAGSLRDGDYPIVKALMGS
jgi:hypothetical protein